MPQKSSIEWTDYTSNPIYFVDLRTMKRIHFCVHASEGCRFCYAEAHQRRFGGGVDKNGNKIKALEFKTQNALFAQAVLNDEELWKIIKLNARLGKKTKIAKMFCFDMTDLFGGFIPDEMRDIFFAHVALCDNITFQILTKRAKEMRDYFSSKASKKRRRSAFIKLCITLDVNQVFIDDFLKKMDANGWVLPNLQLGTSVENQKTADERTFFLLETPAAVRFLSVEPLLNRLDIKPYVGNVVFKCDEHGYLERQAVVSSRDCCVVCGRRTAILLGLDWVIVGGESGAKARPTHPDWVRSIRDQCQAAGVPFFFKQWGEWFPRKAVCELHDENGQDQKEELLISGRWAHWRDGQWMCRVGKKKAGRLLDGREWNEMPEVKQ